MSVSLILPPTVVARAETCSVCRHCHKDQQGDLECRRRAPQVSVLMVQAPPPRTNMMPAPFASFPLVRAEQFCGEWEAKLAS